MTPEQKQQRIAEIRRRLSVDQSMLPTRDEADFLLSLVSQEVVSIHAAAEAATLRLCKAQEVITGLLDLRVPEQRKGFQIWLEDAMTGVATSMRSACVEEVKSAAEEYARKSRIKFDDADKLAFHLRKVAERLESVSIQEQEK